MSRAYRAVRPRGNRVYSVENAMRLYGVCRNTLSNWVSSGLCPIDTRQPQLFRGAELIRFHADRRARTSVQLRNGEFKCVCCKAAVFPTLQTLRLESFPTGGTCGVGRCPDCNVPVRKILSKTECNNLQNCLNTNTSPYPRDEDKADTSADIGKVEGLVSAWHTANDRTIYAWQIYAGCFDTKTVDAYLTSVRDFESFLEGKLFENVTRADADNWRSALRDRARKPSNLGGQGRSTLQHRVSHLRSFFTWLSGETRFRHLDGIAVYFHLPRGMQAKSARRDRSYPSLEQAGSMLQSLPVATMKDRRDRAMLASVFMAGLREQALTSLRLRHVDVQRKQIHHDGETLRAKNGKSFVIDWFPRTEPFQRVVRDWYAELCTLGFTSDDAMFPDSKSFTTREINTADHAAIEPMKSASAIDVVFATASGNIGLSFTPHSARHMLAHLGDQLCHTPEQRKSWSLNLGHSSVKVTWTHYGRVTDERKAAVFAEFAVIENWTGEEMRQMLDYHDHKLVLGTPEFDHAQKLVEARRRRNRAD